LRSLAISCASRFEAGTAAFVGGEYLLAPRNVHPELSSGLLPRTCVVMVASASESEAEVDLFEESASDQEQALPVAEAEATAAVQRLVPHEHRPEAPQCCYVLEIAFQTPKHASWVLRSLELDPELRPRLVERHLEVTGNQLRVTFRGWDRRVCRKAINAFLDSLHTSVDVLERFQSGDRPWESGASG
jgi:tRNA threonylcarbamoyladenosine modification (KEOPS) complex  Pcc1 subunit